jgi:hypothetical protein
VHPLWFDSKGIKCVDKEEYEKQRLTLGLAKEVKMWHHDHHNATICPSAWWFILSFFTVHVQLDFLDHVWNF